jgi:DNA-directed RNA polymerase beta' subunit
MYYKYFYNHVVKKNGSNRKHIFSARSHFTSRTVITPLIGPHDVNEIHVPWRIFITSFRPHIINKLEKRGYNYFQIKNMLIKYVNKFNPILDEIFKELITETNYMGIPVMLQRNPSLDQGSAMNLYITKITMEKTIKLSPLIVKIAGGDFDGDEVNITILLDNLLAEEFKTLRPYYNIPDNNKPLTISNNLSLLSPSYGVLCNMLRDDAEDYENDTVYDRLKKVKI